MGEGDDGRQGCRGLTSATICRGGVNCPTASFFLEVVTAPGNFSAVPEASRPGSPGRRPAAGSDRSPRFRLRSISRPMWLDRSAMDHRRGYLELRVVSEPGLGVRSFCQPTSSALGDHRAKKRAAILYQSVSDTFGSRRRFTHQGTIDVEGRPDVSALQRHAR